MRRSDVEGVADPREAARRLRMSARRTRRDVARTRRTRTRGLRLVLVRLVRESVEGWRALVRAFLSADAPDPAAALGLHDSVLEGVSVFRALLGPERRGAWRALRDAEALARSALRIPGASDMLDAREVLET